MKSIKLNIRGIDRVSDENIIKDVSCYDMVNLEFRDNCYRPTRLDSIGYPKDKNGDAIDLSDYDYIWLHHISTNRIKWIGLQIYTSGDNEVGNLFYLFETDEIDTTKKETATYCVTTDDVVETQIAAYDVSPNQVCFVGNLLVVNDVIYSGLDNYVSSVNRSDIALDMYAKRLDKGFASNRSYLNYNSGGSDANSTDCLQNAGANYAQTKAECMKKGFFQGYMFLRAAVKMYDGSYINITPPVMVTSGINSKYYTRYNLNIDEGLKSIYKSEWQCGVYVSDGNGGTEIYKDDANVSAMVYIDVYEDYLTYYLPKTGTVYMTLPYEKNQNAYKTNVQYTQVDETHISFDMPVYTVVKSEGGVVYENWFRETADTITVTVEVEAVDTGTSTAPKYNVKPHQSSLMWSNMPIIGSSSGLQGDVLPLRQQDRLPAVFNYLSLQNASNKYFKHGYTDGMYGNNELFEKQAGVVIFHNNNHDPLAASNASVSVKYSESSTESVSVNAMNAHNLFCMPDICFLRSRMLWKGNNTHNKTNCACIYKTSHIGVKFGTNLNETYKDFVQGVVVFATKPVTIYKEAEELSLVDGVVPFHPTCKSDAEIETEIIDSLGTFYKIKDFALGDLSSTSYTDVLEGIDLTSEIFANRERLEDSSEFTESMRMSMQYVNNNAVHSCGIVNTLKQTIVPYHQYLTEDYNEVLSELTSIDNSTENVRVYSKFLYNKRYHARIDDGIVKRSLITQARSYDSTFLLPNSLDALADYGLCGVTCITSSSANTEYAMVYGKYNSVSETYTNQYGVALKSVSVGDYSIFYKDYFLGYITSDDCLSANDDNINEDDSREFSEGNNILKVSQTDNPAYYPDAQTYTIGHGAILGMYANNKEVSQGQYGVYPLYVFTTEGIYGMKVDSTGTRMYDSVSPISKEVCVNPNTICGTDYGIVFATENGLCVISGTNVKNISYGLNGATFDYKSDAEDVYSQILDSDSYVRLRDEMSFDGNRNSTHDGTNYLGEFVSYLKDKNTFVVYNTRKQLLVIYNRTSGEVDGDYKFNKYMYLINLSEGVCTKMSAYVKCYIKDYPEGFFLSQDYDRYIGSEVNVGVVASGGGIPNSTLFRLGEINMSGNDYFKMFRASDLSGGDYAVSYNNHYQDVAFVTRPIKIGSENFKGNGRVVVRGHLHSYYDFASLYARSVADADIVYEKDELDTDEVIKTTRNRFFFSEANEKYGVSKVMGLYVYASNDCRRWHRIGTIERANVIVRDLGCTVHHGGYKYFMIAFVGRLKDCSKIDYIEIMGEEKYNDKIR